jgi:hypothetical protein
MFWLLVTNAVKVQLKAIGASVSGVKEVIAQRLFDKLKPAVPRTHN